MPGVRGAEVEMNGSDLLSRVETLEQRLNELLINTTAALSALKSRVNALERHTQMRYLGKSDRKDQP